MQNRLRRVLFVARLRVVTRTANYCCYMSLRCNRLRLLAGLSFSAAAQAKASVSTLLDPHAKSNRPRPSRALVVRTDASSRNRPCPHQSPRLPMPTPTLTAAVGPSGHAGMVVRLARAA